MFVKKILIIGFFSKEKYTYATSFYNNFKKLGYEVDLFDYRKSFLINYLLIKKIKKFKPDLIFFVKAETIYPKTLKYIKNNFNSLLVNFYPDNPFNFWTGNSNSNVLNTLVYYDYFLIWSKLLIPVLKSSGAKKVLYFPFVYDQDIFEQEIFITEQEKKLYKSDVCFVGTWDQEREDILTKLIKTMPNLNFKIWGNLWGEKLAQNSILRKFIMGPAVYPPDLIKIFKESKINLNFIRKQNISAHNMRTFEVPASGGFLLTQYSKEQCKYFFDNGKNIESFVNFKELVDKIKFYLHNNNLRKEILMESNLKVKYFNMQSYLQVLINKINREKIGNEPKGKNSYLNY